MDGQRGEDREESLQRILGVSTSQANGFSLVGSRDLPSEPVAITNDDGKKLMVGKEDMRALRVLAESAENAIRTAEGRTGLIGLDWQEAEL